MYCPGCGEWIQYPEQGYCEHCNIPVDPPPVDDGGFDPESER